MYVFVLEIIGVMIIVAVSAFAVTLHRKVSRLEREIEAEKDHSGKK